MQVETSMNSGRSGCWKARRQNCLLVAALAEVSADDYEHSDWIKLRKKRNLPSGFSSTRLALGKSGA